MEEEVGTSCLKSWLEKVPVRGEKMASCPSSSDTSLVPVLAEREVLRCKWPRFYFLVSFCPLSAESAARQEHLCCVGLCG